MHDSNPFEGPSPETDIPDRDIRRVQRLIRVILAVHLFGIIGTRGVVRADIMGQTKSNLVTLFQSEPAKSSFADRLVTSCDGICYRMAKGDLVISANRFVIFDVVLSMIQLWMMLPLVS